MATVADKAAAAASDAVNEVTAAVGNVSINDQKDAAQASAAEGRRLYIGNLAYATTEDELKQSFVGFTVESVAIPKNPRNDRPVGYAFVDLATAEEAERAIAELSGKEILERKVSVQLARAPATQAEKAERAEHDGRRRPSTRGRGGNRGRGRFSRGGRHAVEHKEHGSDEHSNEVKPLGDITNKKPVDHVHNDKPMGNFRRERGPPSDGIPSKTKVMVANLPYDLTEDKLREIFAPYEPSMTKIALRPIPRFVIEKLQARGEPRKGRGFGFVTLGSEELQKRAVAEMNGVEIDGREIAVKVAIDSPDKIEADAKSAAAVTAAPAQAAVEATA